jgi:hypothetical protein
MLDLLTAGSGRPPIDHFQIVGLGRTRLEVAMRDTVLVPAMESVTAPSTPTIPATGRCIATISTTWPPA